MTNAELLREVETLRKRVAELRQTEEALRESEEKWRSLLKDTPDIVMIVDSEGTLRFINHTVPGIKKQEATGKMVYDYVSPEHHDTMRKNLERIFQTGQSASQEISGVGPHGSLSWYQAQLGPIKQDGRIVAASIITRDITECKRAEEVIRESEKRYRALFQGAAEGIIVVDIETMEFKYVNPAICKMLGYTEEELKLLGVRDIHPKGDLDYVISEFKAQTKEERMLSQSIPCLRKDGTIIYADVNTTNLLIDGRDCNVGFFTDIIERKKAEEKLQESEGKYRTLLENLPQKIFLKDKNSVYLSCNENFARDLKIKPEEFTGKRDFDFFPRKLAEKYRLDDKQIVESGVTKEFDETYIEDGQRRIVHTVKTPVKDAMGNVIGILGIFWDVTELRQAEEELGMYRERMAHAEHLASLGILSATLAHELNQPLTVIRLSIENSLADLETISCPGSVIEDLRDSLSAVTDVNSKVNILRDFARKSSEEVISEVNLKKVAERILKLLRENARRARVSLHIRGMDQLPSVYINEKDIEQLFFALVENAIQAADGKKERRLVISGVLKGRNIELKFGDTCCGISPENLDRIFEPFFTVGPEGMRTGLGLCIVVRIVSEAGGKVRVESKVGKGSTFYIILPINKGRLS